MVLLKHGAGHPGLICYVIVPLVVELHFPSSSNLFFFLFRASFKNPVSCCFVAWSENIPAETKVEG